MNNDLEPKTAIILSGIFMLGLTINIFIIYLFEYLSGKDVKKKAKK